MKNITMMTCVLFAAVAAFADSNKLPPEMVRLPGKGKLVFVNAAGVDDALLKGTADTISNFLSIETEVCKGEWKFDDAKKRVADLKATAAVFVVKDEKLPMSLLALESRWGVANVAGISDSGVTKMALRVAVVLIGGAASKYPASALQPVFCPADLEKAGTAMTIDTLMAVTANLKNIGFEPFQVKPYDEVLWSGNAPEPANDVQRKMKAQYEKEKAAQDSAQKKK